MTLRCFVAMAFGKTDTDEIYSKIIEPTLKSNGLRPIRIDQLTFNEDIDDRILAELDRCDFALADLTYARPSVYFEAGYAQRKVDVIYTCRGDHFSPTSDDEHGNFRVHFDLQMKNIIMWSGPTDVQFSKRLSRLVKQVIRPLHHDRERLQRKNQQAKKFASFSLAEREKRISKICIKELRDRGFSQWKVEHLEGFSMLDSPDWRIRNIDLNWLGTRVIGSELHAAAICVNVSLTKSELQKLYSVAIEHPIFDLNVGGQCENLGLEQIFEQWFLCSIRKVTWQRVTESLRHLAADEERYCLENNTVEYIPMQRLPTQTEVYRYTSHDNDDCLLLRAKRSATLSDTKIYSREKEIFTYPSRKKRGVLLRSPFQLNDYSIKERVDAKKVKRKVRVCVIDNIESDNIFLSKLFRLLTT